jgi:hypothetical protein
MTRTPQRRSVAAAAIARALLLTRGVDWIYRMADKARSELVAALASDAVLDRFNDIAYGGTRSYRPDTSSFRAYLFPWEEETVRRFFPEPPAHVLVGGAGGGREALALLDLGYHVTAFEPSPQLAEALASRARDIEGLTVYRARYEELPHLRGASGEENVDVRSLAPIDAVIAGWGSFSHLRTRELRVSVLESLARATEGPILVSFLGLYEERGAPASLLGRLRRALPRRGGRGSGDMFSVYVGFFHRTNEPEIEALAGAAGLEIVHRSFDQRDTNWPHVILRRRKT